MLINNCWWRSDTKCYTLRYRKIFCLELEKYKWKTSKLIKGSVHFLIMHVSVFQPPDQHRFLHINKDMRSLWIVFCVCGLTIAWICTVYVKIFLVKYEKWSTNTSVGGIIRWHFKPGTLYIRGFIVINIKLNSETRHFLSHMSCRVNCFKISFSTCGCNVFICIRITFHPCFASITFWQTLHATNIFKIYIDDNI